MVRDFYYPSCGAGNIHAKSWEPTGSPRGIVQIVHGIAEHIERYNDFAAYLNQLGYLVVAEDHMGHGKSGGNGLASGHFYGGWFSAVDDSYQLMQDTMSRYPQLPYVLFGHSMGSFIARTILCRYPNSGIKGYILSGTAWMPETLLTAGKFVSKIVCKVSGDEKPSQFLQHMMFGGYNKRIEHVRTAFDWLTRDTKIVDAYIDDPNCGFTASAGLVREMLTGIQYIQQPANLNSMNTSVPVLFVAGGDDPVGDYGNGVKQAAERFKEIGMKSVCCKIYPLCRHEVLNEINKFEIYDDISNWLSDV